MMVRPNRGSPRRELSQESTQSMAAGDGKRWKRTEMESAPRILDHRYVPTFLPSQEVHNLEEVGKARREGALLTLTFDVGKGAAMTSLGGDSIRGSETGEACRGHRCSRSLIPSIRGVLLGGLRRQYVPVLVNHLLQLRSQLP